MNSFVCADINSSEHGSELGADVIIPFWPAIMTNDSESFEKKGLDFNTAAGSQAFGDSVVSKRHRELAEAILWNSGSSSAWCSAHKVSAAAGRMFEDPEFLRIALVRRPWSLEQQSSGPVY